MFLTFLYCYQISLYLCSCLSPACKVTQSTSTLPSFPSLQRHYLLSLVCDLPGEATLPRGTLTSECSPSLNSQCLMFHGVWTANGNLREKLRNSVSHLSHVKAAVLKYNVVWKSLVPRLKWDRFRLQSETFGSLLTVGTKETTYCIFMHKEGDICFKNILKCFKYNHASGSQFGAIMKCSDHHHCLDCTYLPVGFNIFKDVFFTIHCGKHTHSALATLFKQHYVVFLP